MDSAPPQTRANGGPHSTNELPPEAIALASRMFDAARKGDEQSVALLTQALQRGLPANLTNDKGDSLVGLLEQMNSRPPMAIYLRLFSRGRRTTMLFTSPQKSI